jgi:hypothetical protein
MFKVFSNFLVKGILECRVLLLIIALYYSWGHVHKEVRIYNKDGKQETIIIIDSIHSEV